jgi:hypothetical protein
MALQLSAPFLKRLKLRESLTKELERAQDRLPSRTAEAAVESHGKKYTDRIAAHYSAGFNPEAARDPTPRTSAKRRCANAARRRWPL